MVFNDALNWGAFIWFCSCWISYTLYARIRARNTDSLSALLYRYRIDWIKDLMRRDNRISDLTLLGNLMKMVNFLATTTIFVTAGLITALYSAENVVDLLSNHEFIIRVTQEQIQFKILVLVIIFIYAFFRLTWAMRQHTFCSILIGSAPHVSPGRDFTEDELTFATHLAKISDRASQEFNFGLRSYYFALSFLTWFLSPWLLIVACTCVVIILYLREFRSKTLTFLVKSREAFVAIKG